MAAILATVSESDPLEEEAKACYVIERDLHQVITPDYPVAKFQAELELWVEEQKERERQMKSKRFG
jgi:hypothetical protein